jgi:hypothetical protein
VTIKNFAQSFLVVLLAAASLAAQGFDPGCPLPPQLDKIQQPRQIDRVCSISGDAPEPPHILQNKAKNNFCATGTPITLSRDSFVRLQSAAEAKHIRFGDRNNLPPDRAALKNIITEGGVSLGEGTLVQYVAFISEARHSNVGSGESVNCTKRGAPKNDIHIDLNASLDEEACQSVTAEMSPHFRPDSWFRLAGTGSVKKRETPLGSNPVRVRGPLFFDASHVPCTPDKEANPARLSLWEIHPVYAIDVCSETTITACRIDDESLWTPLNEFEP